MQLTPAVHLTAVRTDKFKSSQFSVYFVTERKSENCAKNALLPSVLLRGCEKYPTMRAISLRTDDLYGAGISVSAQTRGELQTPGFCASCISDSCAYDGMRVFENLLDLLSEILFHPLTENGVFKAEYVENEKEKQILYIRSLVNNKTRYASRRCEEIMCEGERYAVPSAGTEEDTAKITPESLWDYYRNLLETAPIELFYAGDLPFEELKRLLMPVFGGFTEIPRPLGKTERVYDARPVKNVTEEEPVNQSKLVLGYRTPTDYPSEGHAAYMLLRMILSGSPISKFFMNVREKLSLCYYCGASADTMKGIMLVSSGVRAENAEKARAAIEKQIADCADGKISDKELAAAKSGYESAFREIYDSPAALESYYLTRRIADAPEDPEKVLENILAVTKEELAAEAQKLRLDTVFLLKGTLNGSEDEDDE